MKKYWKLLLVILSLYFLAGCGLEKFADEDVLKRVEKSQTIVWGVKDDTRLFGMMDIKTGVIKGFDIDIAKEITKEILGSAQKAKFLEVISKTRIPLLRNENIDAIIATMSISSEREKVVDFSNVYFQAGQSLLVKKGSRIHSLKDLNESDTVLVVKGSASAENIRKIVPQVNISELESYAECFTALKSGQGEVMTTDSAILLGLSEENPEYVLTGGNFTNEPYGIAVNKGQKPFLRKINQALGTIKKNGRYQQIYNKWFSKTLKNQEE
jgi:putative glutamine transport system substrate-binding protein